MSENNILNNSEINPFSIDSDFKGNFVFEGTISDEDSSSEKSKMITKAPYNDNIDNFVDYFSNRFGFGKEFVRKILDEIYKYGKEGFLERHKDKVDSLASEKKSENDNTIWHFVVYKEDNKEEE